MRGIRQVFLFTLQQQTRSKGYRAITVILALLLFLLPAIILPLIERSSGDNAAEAEPDTMYSEASDPFAPAVLYVADETDGPAAELAFLREVEIPAFQTMERVPCADLDEATAKAAGRSDALIFHLSEDKGAYQAEILIPEGSSVAPSDADSFASVLSGFLDRLLAEKAGIPAETAEVLNAPAAVRIEDPGSDAESEADDPLAGIREILSFVLPYLNVMLIYFLVLFYGQGVANCVLLEKSSKLMDTFLVSVQPRAMIFGKVFAVWLSSAIQFVSWVVSLILGFAVGTALVRMINPDSHMAILALFRALGSLSGLFTAGEILVCVLLILAGFLLYCAIASIGGALAGKQEDLGSTNILFTLILIVSFFATLRSGFISDRMASGMSWMDLIPFTAVLITPSRVLLGYVPVTVGLLSLGITVLLCVLAILLAGRIYKLMSLYKGKPPKFKELLTMLRQSAKHAS